MRENLVFKTLGNLFADALDQRVSDDSALDFLCGCLDSGVPPGIISPISHEPWSVVLRRRVSNKYPRGKAPLTTWTVRHFYVRQMGAFNESHQDCAARVAKIWTAAGHRINATGLLAAAERKAARRDAHEWIDVSEKWVRRTWPNKEDLLTSAFVYSGIEANITKIADELRLSRKVK